MRRGNEAAFEVMFERYAPAITSFCRHMVGSPEEAEEAAQHTFAAAYRSLRSDDRDMALKPWLYKIARNHCISILRERPDQVSATPDAVTAHLAEQVERRADLRALLRDLSELPEEQREALLLTEISGLSHQEVGRILRCPAQRVKGLVFRARRNLMEWRDARETPCDAIREQLATLRGTELRRNELRHHLRVCPGCRAFLEQVREQRRRLATALPVAVPAGFKASVMGAIGLGGGSAAGGAAIGVGATAPVAGTTLAKLAVGIVVVGGGAMITQTASHEPTAPPRAADSAVREAAVSGTRTRSGRRAQTRSTWRPGLDPDAGDRNAPPAKRHDDPDRAGGDVSTAPDLEPESDAPPPRQGVGAEAQGESRADSRRGRKGDHPQQAGHRAPRAKHDDPPGQAEGHKPDQAPPAGKDGAPPHGNGPEPKDPPKEPKRPVDVPNVHPGDDDPGLGLELSVPLLGPIAI